MSSSSPIPSSFSPLPPGEKGARALLLVVVLWTWCNLAQANPAPLRRHDDRPMIDLQKAQAAGISRYESKRLILLTDIEPDKARQVVTLIDQVYPIWEQQLGIIPTARDNSEFQITGYLMRDEAKFERAGLVRRNLKIIHGQHAGYEFWMKDAEYDYYREHLLLHEATHCVMQCLDDGLKPIWYLEGMAEFFGTHESIEKTLTFGLIPSNRQVSLGFGRIEMIRQECKEGRALSAAQVMQLGVTEFSESRTTPYAWSWAFCTFLARHPRFTKEFQQLCQHWEADRFQSALVQFWKQRERDISAEWEIFRDSLCYGWDLQRGASLINVPPMIPLSVGKLREFAVKADQGWQSTGLKIEVGQKVLVSATGRIVLARTTKPWESEPQGISVRYAEGRPMGRLLGAVLRDQPAEEGAIRHWEFFDIGPSLMMESKSTGTLFVRVNDRWNELADNEKQFTVQVSLLP